MKLIARIAFFLFLLTLCCGFSTRSQADVYLAANALLSQNNKAVCQVLLKGEYVNQEAAGGVQITGRNWKFVGNLYSVTTIPSTDGSVKIQTIIYGKLTVGKSVTLCQATVVGSVPQDGQTTMAIRLEGVRQQAGKVYFDTNGEMQVTRGFLTIKLK